MRLDRWFKRRYPALTHGRLEKLLRTGQIRVDGARAKANTRLEAGQTVRIPPLGTESTQSRKPKPAGVSPKDAAFIQSLVIYKDADMIAVNKPAGLAVQGGSKTTRHIDGMLDALQFDAAERPRLVHRLDRDTSGVLILARNAKAATRLGELFQ
ncbi:MAG: RluA family pseudouridine synthase, partial [Rhodospirillaceae bacterium]|nr:RluA family pseudouridine synthase [Rhodospirillaceae bacterium]